MNEVTTLFCGLIFGLIPAILILCLKVLKNGVVVNVQVMQPPPPAIDPAALINLQKEIDKATQENATAQQAMDAYLQGINAVMTGGNTNG